MVVDQLIFRLRSESIIEESMVHGVRPQLLGGMKGYKPEVSKIHHGNGINHRPSGDIPEPLRGICDAAMFAIPWSRICQAARGMKSKSRGKMNRQTSTKQMHRKWQVQWASFEQCPVTLVE